MKLSWLFLFPILLTAPAHAFSSMDGSLIDLNSEQPEIMATASEIQITPVASDSDEVPANLKIMGKGILNTEQQTSMAVACVGKPLVEGGEPECNQLRVIEFDRNRIPQWQGQAFEISNAQSFQVSLKKEYRKKYRMHFLRMKKDIKNTQAASKGVAKLIGTVGTTYLLLAAAGVKITIGASVAGGIAILAGPFVVGIILSSMKIDIVGITANAVMAPFRGLGNSMIMDGSVSMTAKDGWNWAAKPTEVSDKKYEKIKGLFADFSTGAVKLP